MPPTVNARIPLSLLEAVRRMDTPETDTEEEYVQELRNKRLGLSDTVYQQIRRYSDAVRKGQAIPYAEAIGLGTLIGRRPDAGELFDNAGKILANDAYAAISGTLRKTIHLVPSVVARPLALSQIRQFVARFFGGTLTRTGSSLALSVTDSVTVNSGPDSVGCTYYSSALRELLRLLMSGAASVDHVCCLQRGDKSCEWRAEWRGQQSEAA
jgi:predicted hydrocarbon binding protein